MSGAQEQTPNVALVVGRNVHAARAAELAALEGPDGSIALPDGTRLRVRLYGDPAEALSEIRQRPHGAILIDNRGDDGCAEFGETTAGKILPGLLASAGSVRIAPRNAVIVILPRGESTALHSYAIGSLQLGGVLVDPPSLAEILSAAHRVARPSEPGKIALCLAGGGIEGMFYEIGVLRALDAVLDGRAVCDFDVFSGISAGAVIAAFLANGVRPAEIADALHGRESRIAPVTRTMLFDPNLGEVARRIGGAVTDMMRGRFLTSPIDSAMKVAPNALFSGDKLREYLSRELSKPGLTNDFTKLGRQLYIGATDQDSGAHVTFGVEGMDDVPISSAIRASAAMTPYYAPEQIGGHYFVDGIFTRTIDLDVAVANGARLVICIDPLTPVQVDEPGFASGRGGLFTTVQSVKSMIRTRFSEVIGRAEESYPEVTVFVFSPTPRDLEKMSGTLMRFFYRTETEEMAFESAQRRIAADYDWLAADLARHGFALRKP
ncbi:MAG: patatin-like phospholipase family protein [Proteobacteria bacterium]|jgi:predicted acylesterase/phospholipase RssA|nr:patatin-like phospholipase family protein [Pseudomonadota bacterium]